MLLDCGDIEVFSYFVEEAYGWYVDTGEERAVSICSAVKVGVCVEDTIRVSIGAVETHRTSIVAVVGWRHYEDIARQKKVLQDLIIQCYNKMKNYMEVMATTEEEEE